MLFLRLYNSFSGGIFFIVAYSNCSIRKNIDVNNITFGEPKKGMKGGKMVPVLYGNRLLRVQTPSLSIPFGVTRYVAYFIANNKSWFRIEDENQGAKLFLQLAFNDLETNEEVKAFYQFLQALDEKIKKEALDHHREWFNLDKQKVQSLVDVGYKSNLRAPVDPKYSPLLKVKIPMWEGSPRLDIFEDQVSKGLDDLTKGSRIMGILEMRQIWIAANQFGGSWNILQAAIQEKRKSNSIAGTYAFVEKPDQKN
jgi:hypothetical protein